MADEQQLRSYLKRVTIELAEERERLHSYRHEPIAIVGMACRYPGGAGSPEQLWRLLEQGRDGITEFPADRGWDLESLYDPDPDHRGTSYSREGGFLADAADFDADFFGIAPREALAADPQQRLLLEACWQALEEAGIDPASLRGESAGVFAGVSSVDYRLSARSGGELEGLAGIGSLQSVVAGRVAYTFGLEGPAVSVDTACSSSLVALHLAAQALRGGECSLALAGGVTVLSTPGIFIEFSRQRALSSDGRCKSFAEAADGTGFSEGVGVLALERLSDAQRNGRQVLATIRGSAVNQDGASNGLTAPNGPSQERVIRQALANARLSAKDVDAVEAHGTGTTLGDPIEAQALLATYGVEREGGPLKLGSIKSNIGHSAAAAGVAGVIKMTLAMREGVLPKTLHVDEPSSKVDWDSGEIELLTEAVPWQANGRPRRAGISSFGASGTNAHLILEEAPEPAEPEGEGEKPEAPGEQALPGPILLPLSAKTEPALKEAASRLATQLEESPELDPIDVGFSLATTRACFEQRAVAVGKDRKELLAALDALAAGAESPGLARGVAKVDQRPVFLFPGQGAQSVQMAKELLEASPAFAKEVEACEAALDPYVDWSLSEILSTEDESWLERLDIVQPALFAVMVSLAKLWLELGAKPSVLVGHSQGEIAAAHIAAALSLDDAARVIALRGKAMAKIAGKGAMLSVSLTPEELEPLLEPWGEQISLAAINGPASLVCSGEPQALKQLHESCEAKGIRSQPIAVDYAAHSAQIEELEEELIEAFSPISPQSTEIPLHSTLTGEPIEGTELGAEYWYRNLRQTVLLEPVISSLLTQGKSTLIEIGPHPVLSFGVQETIDAAEAKATVIGTLRRDDTGPERFALSLAQAHAAGAEIEWDAFFKGSGAKQTKLPTYPFQRKRYWLEGSGGTGDASAMGLSDPEHPLLGAAIESPAGEGLALSGRISLATHPWLKDHAVFGTVLLPGTGFLELALRAAAQVGAEAVSELTLQAPLILPESGAVQIQVTVAEPGEDGERAISVHSRPEGDEAEAQWTCHALGALAAEAPEIDPRLAELGTGAWPPEGAEPLEVEFLYDRLSEYGFDYGPAFQNRGVAWRRGEEVFAEISLAEEQAQAAGRFGIHPALLDFAFHPGMDLRLAAMENEEAKSSTLPLPFSWRDVRLYAPGASSLRFCLAPVGKHNTAVAFDETGAPVVSIGSIVARAVEQRQLEVANRHQSLYRLNWSDHPSQSSNGSELRLAILGEAEIDGIEAERYVDLQALTKAIEDGVETPEIVLTAFASAEDEALPEATSLTTQKAFALLRSWVAEEGMSEARLVFVTKRALPLEGEDPDLRTASLGGLLRSAHSEHRDRFALIDTDDTEASQAALSIALGSVADEPELAIREGRMLVPRLVPVQGEEEAVTRPIDPDTTVLITGGTSGLGVRVARHLASAHGVRQLLLVSRRGSEADGVDLLKVELEELGAEVRIAACDVTDRDQLAELIDSISPEHPLGAVVHSAGVLDDGVLEALDAERLERVMRPKVDASWYLHELTESLDLSQFLLFSSGAGLLGGAAQTNYAAANGFLDALAAHRRLRGLPATSLAWGMWEQESRLLDKDELGLAAAKRIVQLIRERLGFAPMNPERGLELFDAARSIEGSLFAPVEFDNAVLRAQAGAGTLPAILRGLVRVPGGRQSEQGSLARRIAGSADGEREAIVLGLVRTHAAAVLGHASGAEIEPDRAFNELGFDSLAAVELRNRLAAATGLRLPPTLVFDFPTAAALAKFLLAEAEGEKRRAGPAPRAAASTEEPIAVVGMACRYPGGAGSPEQLWSLMAAGADAISDFPADRGWDLDRLYDPDPGHPGTSYTKQGGFVGDAVSFDPGFFGISPREAVAMDPQQRLLLEASWKALEDAGIDPSSLRGSQAGVFVGAMYQDYGSAPGLASAKREGYVFTGGAGSVVSGRVAYTLGLEGPTMTVDTACSSSLVALHLASQALRGGECSLALAGGVTVLSTPGMILQFSLQRGLAPDGRCKAFSEAADGTALAEGVGVLALERLSDAQRNGRQVLALIRGSAVNQDGASNGLTAPNGPSQERVIRQALANARLSAKDIDAVEAHGTGTTLGDPIEAGALLATYGQERAEGPLKLGSIKSNIGHAQAAAGVAGVIKMALAMRKGLLPKTLHVDEPSSKVDWNSGEIELLTEAVPWQANGRPRRAGISSFGASGTNAHLILEEAPEPAEPEGEGEKPEAPGEQALPGPILLPLSAKTEPALKEAASRLATQLEESPEQDPIDVGFSLATTRACFEQRAVAVGKDRKELLAALDALAAGAESPGLARGVAKVDQRPVFLFPGQGAQSVQMAKELLEASPAFAKEVEACEAALDPYVDWSLSEILSTEDESWLERLDIVQPALFAVMVSLAKLWLELGAKPSVLVGHSQGEIAAAHIAAALSLDDAARVIALRGKAMAKIAGKGAMLSVSLTPEELEPLLEPWGEQISLAAINGPASLVCSGEPQALKQLHESCEAKGIRSQPIAVDYAAHSAQIEELEEELIEAFSPISPQSTEIPLHSTLTGEPIEGTELGAEYWYRNLRQTVLLEPVISSLLTQGKSTLIEIGPHPVLSFGVQETIDAAEAKATVIGTLRRDDTGPERFALSLAQAHAAGAEIEWDAFFKGSGAKQTKLPTYPFQRKRYWLEGSGGTGDASAMGLSDPEHPLLGAAIESPAGEGLALSGRISLATHPWLKDHAVFGTVLLPGTGFLELALRAAAQVGAEAVSELTLQAPLILPESGAVQIQVTVAEPGEDGERAISVHSRPEGDEAEAQWTCHALGALAAEAPEIDPRLAELGTGAWPPEGAEPLEVEFLYDRLSEHGFDYGPAFQGARAAWRRGEEVFAEISLAEEQAQAAGRFGIHPALLDAAAHAGLDLGLGGGSEEVALPFAWSGVRLHTGGVSSLRVRVALEQHDSGLVAVDATGAPLISVDSVALRPIDPSRLRAAGRRHSLYRVEWEGVRPHSAEGSELRLATIGDPEIGDLEAERHADLPAFIEALEAGTQAPEVLLAEIAPELEDLPEAAHSATRQALALLQAWLAEERLEETRLAFITNGAIAAGEGEDPDLALAPIWGLVRSAHSEHPGRFALIDTDGAEASLASLPEALRAGIEEPQLALREGKMLVPRLARVEIDEQEEPETRPIDPDTTVLITGGTSGLGALIARHLAEHGARRLLLVSRSGPQAEGAGALEAELGELGAEARVAACDVTDRGELEALLDSIPEEHPLGAVVHSAAVLDDGILASLDPERLERVMRPKLDAAWHLHELTAELELSQFVMFSSAGGVLGTPGQANYAAANASLDALAAHRRARKLPATSLAWGGWRQTSSLTSKLDDADLARLGRLGFVPMSSEQVLELFDAGRALVEPLLAPMEFDKSALRAQASAGTMAPILRGLVRVPARHRGERGLLARQLAEVPEGEREAVVLAQVRTHVAALLGHASVEEVEPDRAFQELGFDSLAAVELRNRLSADTGLRLPPTLVFDYPSAAAVAGYLMAEVVPDSGGTEEALREAQIGETLAKLEEMLGTAAVDGQVRERVGLRLRAFLTDLASSESSDGDAPGEDLGSMSHEEIFELIDEELGEL